MLFIVKMEHPDGDKWNQYVLEHVRYLQGLIEQGYLLASGPVVGAELRAGLLIFRADNQQQVHEWVAADPFSREDLIVSLTVCQWDPLFGSLSQYASGALPPELDSL